MANVLFKRGEQSHLPALPNQSSNDVIDGALYFTTDTKRLFLGNGSTLLPIAEGITTVSSATALPDNPAQHAGEFYYIKPADADGATVGNILAYSDGTRWLQVNRSTHVENVFYGTRSQDGVQIATDTDNKKVASFIEVFEQSGISPDVTATFKIKDGGNVSLTRGTNGELVISVPDDQNTLYTVSTSTISTGGAAIDLTPSDANGTASAVKLIPNGGITITRTASNEIAFGVDSTGVGAVAQVTVDNGNGLSGGSASNEGFYVKLDLSNGTHVEDGYNPIFEYGDENPDTHIKPSAKIVNGTAALDVYSKHDVDTRLSQLENALNAMTYIGTTSALPSGDIHIGDSWKASSTFSYLPAGAADSPENYVYVPAGSLIIAKGTSEDEDGVIDDGLAFDIITGDVVDTTYAVNKTTHGINIEGVTGHTEIIGGIALATGTDSPITLTDDQAAGTTRVVTVGLSPISVGTNTSASTTTSQSKGQNLTVTHIKGIETDGFGRVTNLITETATVVDTDNQISDVAFTTSTVSTVSNAVTIAARVDEAGGSFDQDAFTLKSTGSINVTAGNKEVTVDVVWGSF